MASTTAELIWIEQLLFEIGIKSTKKPIIWCDNLSTVALSANPVLHSRTKHIEIDLHFVREQISKGRLDVRHIPAGYQRADILTKALSTKNFSRLKADLKVVDWNTSDKAVEIQEGATQSKLDLKPDPKNSSDLAALS